MVSVGRDPMMSAICPDCGERITLDSLSLQGSRLFCPSCGAHLQIVELDPVELDWVYVYPVPGWEDDRDCTTIGQGQYGTGHEPGG
jgi:lysine biosynthesis protein LysW